MDGVCRMDREKGGGAVSFSVTSAFTLSFTFFALAVGFLSAPLRLFLLRAGRRRYGGSYRGHLNGASLTAPTTRVAGPPCHPPRTARTLTNCKRTAADPAPRHRNSEPDPLCVSTLSRTLSGAAPRSITTRDRTSPASGTRGRLQVHPSEEQDLRPEEIPWIAEKRLVHQEVAHALTPPFQLSVYLILLYIRSRLA